MKKLTLVVAVMTGFASYNAAAADGDITINGLVIDETCTIDVEGQGADATLTLPTVPTSALPAAGETAGDTPFTITLSNCTNANNPGLTTVRPYFEQTNVDQTTGYLKNIAADATADNNVQVQIAKLEDGSEIDLTDNANNYEGKDLTAEAEFDYLARYVAVNGAALPTTVSTVLQYSVQYQ